MLKREFWKPVVKTIHYNFVKFFLASSTLRGVKNEISSFYFLKLECKILMFSEGSITSVIPLYTLIRELK